MNIHFNQKTPRFSLLKMVFFFCITSDCWKSPVLSVQESRHCSSRWLWYHWHDSWRSDQFWPKEKPGVSGQGSSACSLQQAVWRRKWASLVYERLFIRDISEIQVRGAVGFEETGKKIGKSNVCLELVLRGQKTGTPVTPCISSTSCHWGKEKGRRSRLGCWGSGVSSPPLAFLPHWVLPACMISATGKMKYLLFLVCCTLVLLRMKHSN